MESRTPRPARTTCSVPGLLLGLSKLCKLTKVCAAPDVADVKTEFGDGGGYVGYDPKLVMVILFEAISALKSAYFKMQRAHFPYDPANVAFADEAIVSELDGAAALQRLCGTGGGGVGSLVNERWLLLQELEAEARKKESDIAMLRRELEAAQRANSRLSKRVRSSSGSGGAGEVAAVARKMAAAPGALLEMCRAAAAAVHEFAELVAGMTASSSDRGAGDAVQRRYALEARLARTILAGGGAGAGEEEEEDRGEGFDRIMSCCDPVEALMEHPGSGFARFCASRYLAAVPPETEAAALGNLDQRAFVSRGGHPRTWLYRAFATTARLAWALRVAAKASPGGVRVFYARRGSGYSEEHMERVAVAAPPGGAAGGAEKLVVAFTVTPGFKVGGAVVACRVFLCRPEDAGAGAGSGNGTELKFR